MPEQLRVDRDAPWKQGFRLPQVISTQVAQAAPTRGLTASNLSGVYQLAAGDASTRVGNGYQKIAAIADAGTPSSTNRQVAAFGGVRVRF